MRRLAQAPDWAIQNRGVRDHRMAHFAFLEMPPADTDSDFASVVAAARRLDEYRARPKSPVACSAHHFLPSSSFMRFRFGLCAVRTLITYEANSSGWPALSRRSRTWFIRVTASA